jgi:hypothetical protein
MENNIFLLNGKNELLLYYEKNEHVWKIPTFNMIIEDIKKCCEESYGIKAELEKKIENNYICRIKKYVMLNKYQKWFRYYDLVNMKLYDTHKNIIEEIYKDFKLTIILDIDLTLLESYNDCCFIRTNPDYIIEYNNFEYKIFFRPHLKYFLDSVSKFVNIIYWTAATKSHQEIILKITELDKYCEKVYYRDTCTFEKGYYIKDMNKIDVQLNRTLLIDDNIIHKTQNPFNCFLIKAWGPNLFRENFADDIIHTQDVELVKMINILRIFSDNMIHNNFTLEDCFKFLSNI